MADHLVIYYNDSIDSDNWASALALIKATAQKQNTRVIWIAEPRQVSFGLFMEKDKQDKCLQLIKEHFPKKQPAFKVLLAGLLREQDIANLPDSDREILRLAVRPPYGPHSDAILHRTLTAWDQAACLSHWSNSKVEVFTDVESLNSIQNPVNLNMHHQEELIARFEDEIRKHQTIMKEPLDQRVESLRKWYQECIQRAENRSDIHGSEVRPLDYEKLCEEIKAAKSVKFFGGSSLNILERFINSGIANKVDCHMQVGTTDLKLNLFENQFNVGLNAASATKVFENTKEFQSFTVVPSHTAQHVKYSAEGLKEWGGRCLETRMLGFNCREDPLKIATGEVTLKDHAGKSFSMPDLTAFLCKLIDGFQGTKGGRAKVDCQNINNADEQTEDNNTGGHQEEKEDTQTDNADQEYTKVKPDEKRILFNQDVPEGDSTAIDIFDLEKESIVLNAEQVLSELKRLGIDETC